MRLSPETIYVLHRGWNIRFLGRLGTTDYFRPGFGVEDGRAGRMWGVCDNGGEWNVWPVNVEEEQRSVPYAAGGLTIDASTTAYRIALVIKGDDIDYGHRCPELYGELVEAFSPGGA